MHPGNAGMEVAGSMIRCCRTHPALQAKLGGPFFSCISSELSMTEMESFGMLCIMLHDVMQGSRLLLKDYKGVL